MRFKLHVGIDYSGAETPTRRLKGLQVYAGGSDRAPARVPPPSQPEGQWWNWTRKEVAEWIVSLGRDGRTFIVGIDHAFSFPKSYLDVRGVANWGVFLNDFVEHWPTDKPVRDLRKQNPRPEDPRALRLTDTWTSSAKSVFRFDVQGQVAMSSHAGIPWLHHIRKEVGDRVHFWPFDGWDVPDGRSVIAEVYPSILRKRFPKPADRTGDAHDAFAVACWLRDCDERGILDYYLHPPLTDEEQRLARREGWILGIC